MSVHPIRSVPLDDTADADQREQASFRTDLDPGQVAAWTSLDRDGDCQPHSAAAVGGHRASDHYTGTRQFGTGRKARVAAMRTAGQLRDRGIAAAALFKPSMGGWIVQIHPGGIRQRP